ncbi:MAG: cyclic nucleotide-binding domain-containing protein [Desulfobacteraceae bacterium]|nr:cyclic nucleotide-binding domain-containing protein [Desulfobacteraceae bacterium]MBC2757729.1 cyclic nucleotide-binding domain-containing protein [Desulfobacteraceae bacterium]
MHLDLQNIQEIDLFKDLSPEELDKILPIVHPVKIIEGERLIREGDTSQILYVIISGNYMIHFKDGRAFTLHNKGDMIGWTTVAGPFTYQESAVALTGGEALTIPIEEFLHLMQGDSDLGSKITKKVTEIVRQRIAFIKGPIEDEE